MKWWKNCYCDPMIVSWCNNNFLVSSNPGYSQFLQEVMKKEKSGACTPVEQKSSCLVCLQPDSSQSDHLISEWCQHILNYILSIEHGNFWTFEVNIRKTPSVKLQPTVIRFFQILKMDSKIMFFFLSKGFSEQYP